MAHPLKAELFRLYLASTILLAIIAAPLIFSAQRSSKDVRWLFYKRIGSNLALKEAYKNVQRFTMMVKLNIFFELGLLTVGTVLTNNTVARIIGAILIFLLTASLMLSCYGVSIESNNIIIGFITCQVLVMAGNICALVFVTTAKGIWAFFVLYVTSSILCAILTIYFTIRCQSNFGKNIKTDMVNWNPFDGSSGIITRASSVSPEKYDSEILGMPIEEEDEEAGQFKYRHMSDMDEKPNTHSVPSIKSIQENQKTPLYLLSRGNTNESLPLTADTGRDNHIIKLQPKTIRPNTLPFRNINTTISNEYRHKADEASTPTSASTLFSPTAQFMSTQTINSTTRPSDTRYRTENVDSPSTTTTFPQTVFSLRKVDASAIHSDFGHRQDVLNNPGSVTSFAYPPVQRIPRID
ncbi:hypothetical protein BDB01DRAFT_503563 [Pilobolus umbonatus]|nr:hypothetical protein BDB01DRAFT_503563 [Pilobolus umbonatus]